MLSIYTSLFRAIENKFNYSEALENFCAFGEEVIICVNTSKDGTLEAVRQWKSDNSAQKLTILESDFSYDDPMMDGKIKNKALQATSHYAKIGLDMDERLPLRHKDKWVKAAQNLGFGGPASFLIPSLDLWGDVRSLRWDNEHNKKFKWYMHRGGLFRGAFNGARRSNGKVDISKSDTCELINERGDLVSSSIINDENVNDLSDYTKWLEQIGLFVYHLGYADLSRRAFINANFWKGQWQIESGDTNEIPTNEMQLFKPTYPHNLKLWNEL